jgi:hypothetical protein
LCVGLTALQAATCNNVLPVTKPGIRFACPNNRQFDPEKLENVMPSDDNCCSQVRTLVRPKLGSRILLVLATAAAGAAAAAAAAAADSLQIFDCHAQQ